MDISTMRENVKMTQSDVAAQMGIQRSAVAKWENGTTKPRADKLTKLAQLYHCTVDELIDAMPTAKSKEA